MNIFALIIISIKSLFSHTARTILTLLGIIVSVMAIMSVVTMGESFQSYVSNEIEAFGTDVVQVEPSLPETNHVSTENASSMAMGAQITTLTEDDAKALALLPNVMAYNTGLLGQARARYKDVKRYVTLLGSSADAPLVDPGVEIAYGRFFSEEEHRTSENVVVLGSTVAEALFGTAVGDDVIGTRVALNDNRYKVVGILKERGASFGFSFDDMIYLPHTTLQKKILGVDYLGYVTFKVRDVTKIDQTAEDMRIILRSRHEIDKPSEDDFSAMTIIEAQDMFNTILGGVNILLLALASISLVVGGIGIMNIMLVSIEERRMEIGLRKALGARKKDVVKQFVIESIVIACAGSVIGIVITTVLLSAAFSAIRYAGFDDIHFFIPTRAILVAMIFSVTAGIVFGVYPARRAAEISPMQAISS
jgi:putative ABC transport system permease protein